MNRSALVALLFCSVAFAQDPGPWSVGVGLARAHSDRHPSAYGTGEVLDLGRTILRDYPVQMRFRAEGFALQGTRRNAFEAPEKLDATATGAALLAEGLYHLNGLDQPGPFVAVGFGWSSFAHSHNDVILDAFTGKFLQTRKARTTESGPAFTASLGWRPVSGWDLEARWENHLGKLPRSSTAAVVPDGTLVYAGDMGSDLRPSFFSLMVRRHF